MGIYKVQGMIMKFLSSALALTMLQMITVVLAVAGLFYFPISFSAIGIFLVFYFLYAGVGVSMMLHRYWTHKSFEFRSNIVKWICTFFALASCRGDIMGWVYIHRMHHKYADTEKDPHPPNIKGWRIFFPFLLKYDENINKFVIKDLINETQLHIYRYYMIYVLLFVLLLGVISPWLLFFAWILPVAATQIVVSSFLYIGHKWGYTSFDINNTSKNNWLFSLLYWGEGWHNNHHAKPQSYSFKNDWWEFDIMAPVIWMVKK